MTTADYSPRSVQAGEWRITSLSDGTMRLDGGAMWGVVPQNMWKRFTPPAEDNTIALALRPFLAERGDVKLVVEVGIGDRWESKWMDIYHIDRSTTLESSLRECGLAPGDITHVIASHCHFDHIGGQVVLRDGKLAPQFPNARHMVPRIEFEMARNPDHVRRGSYRPDDIVPIDEAGLLDCFEGDAELLPGVRAYDASGHSDGVSVITFNEHGEGDTAIFWADVVPTGHHIQPPFIMAYDIDVVSSFDNRSKWLKRACEGEWIGLFYHDLDRPFGRITHDGRRYEFQAVAGE